MDNNQIIRGLEYSVKLLNETIVSGAENCWRVATVYNNLNVAITELKNIFDTNQIKEDERK